MNATKFEGMFNAEYRMSMDTDATGGHNPETKIVNEHGNETDLTLGGDSKDVSKFVQQDHLSKIAHEPLV